MRDFETRRHQPAEARRPDSRRVPDSRIERNSVPAVLGYQACAGRVSVLNLLRRLDCRPAFLLCERHLPSSSRAHVAFLFRAHWEWSVVFRCQILRRSPAAFLWRTLQCFNGSTEPVTFLNQKLDDMFCCHLSAMVSRSAPCTEYVDVPVPGFRRSRGGSVTARLKNDSLELLRPR